MARNQGLLFLLLVSFSFTATVAYADDVHRAGISTTETLQPVQNYVPYGAPKMVGMPLPKRVQLPVVKPPQKQPPLKANVTEIVKPPPKVVKPVVPPPQAQVPMKEGVLPAQFLGRWQVMGSRSNVVAQPQFQQGIDGIFSMTTSNTWTIQGSPEQGYMLSTDSGVSTPLSVASAGNQAVLRYQHPIKNTVAQEALVMQMTPGGVQFDGLERITIIKQGEPPRAKVTYKLIGHRQ